MRKYIAYELYLQRKSAEDGRAHDPYRSYDEEIALIRQWADQDQKPPQPLLSRWLSHPDRRVLNVVALNARWIDRDLARQIYEFSEYDALSSLAQNPHLSPSVVANVATWLVDDWEACVRGKPPCVAAPWHTLFALLKAQGEKVPADTIRRAYKLGKLPSELYSSLPDGVDLELSASQLEAISDAFASFSQWIASEHPPVPPDILCEALPHLEHSKSMFRALLRHPNTDVTVLRVALECSAASAAHDFVVCYPELRWDPNIRPQLLASDNPDVLAALIEDAEPEVAGQLILRLVALGHSSFVPDALRARPADQPIVLNTEELLLLLQNSDRDSRLAVLGSMEKFKNATLPRSQEVPTFSDSTRAEAHRSRSGSGRQVRRGQD